MQLQMFSIPGIVAWEPYQLGCVEFRAPACGCTKCGICFGVSTWGLHQIRCDQFWGVCPKLTIRRCASGVQSKLNANGSNEREISCKCEISGEHEISCKCEISGEYESAAKCEISSKVLCIRGSGSENLAVAPTTLPTINRTQDQKSNDQKHNEKHTTIKNLAVALSTSPIRNQDRIRALRTVRNCALQRENI
jgi:hypothetical protein